MTVNEKNNQLTAFKFNATDQTIRVEMVNQIPYFIAKDVCESLDLADVSKAVEKLDDDEKLTRKLFVSGQNRNVWLVNESGLYNLIFRSNKPEAKAFRKWVTSEVLPAIRKTGEYSIKTKASIRGEFVDFRAVPYDTVNLNNRQVRHLVHEDADWYCVIDILTAIGSTTAVGQWVGRLNAVKTLAKKFFVFGATHPAWYTKSTGLQLLLSGSRVVRNKVVTVELPLVLKGGEHGCA